MVWLEGKWKVRAGQSPKALAGFSPSEGLDLFGKNFFSHMHMPQMIHVPVHVDLYMYMYVLVAR